VKSSKFTVKLYQVVYSMFAQTWKHNFVVDRCVCVCVWLSLFLNLFCAVLFCCCAWRWIKMYQLFWWDVCALACYARGQLPPFAPCPLVTPLHGLPECTEVSSVRLLLSTQSMTHAASHPQLFARSDVALKTHLLHALTTIGRESYFYGTSTASDKYRMLVAYIKKSNCYC